MPANALLLRVPWTLTNAYQHSLIPARNTTEPHVFGAIANPDPQLRAISRSALRLRIPPQPQPRSRRPSDQGLPLGTLKGTSVCGARYSLDLCTRCSEGSLRGSVLCDLRRAARRMYRDDDRNFIQYLKLTSD
jgi:hypothetical protein